MFEDRLKEHKNKLIVLVAALLVLDVLIWWQIFEVRAAAHNLEVYFLNVGQGDSGLVILPGGVEVLVDGGPPNGRVLDELDRILKRGDRYIDLVVLSHSQLDHFGGLVEVMRRYRVGAFLWNGIEGTSAAFDDFIDALRNNGAKEVVLRSGDAIRHGKSEISVLGPRRETLSFRDANDASLVLEVKSRNSKILFTGDIGEAVEKSLALSDVDVLKVAHHGSKFSTSANFLSVIRPEAAVIGVGKNSYGHPTAQVLERLEGVGARIFRTDSDGTVRFVIDGEEIRIFKEGGIK